MILRKFMPDIVLSFGGYISVPIVMAARVLKVPVVIHEQTLHAGLANKVAASVATKICVSWPDSVREFPSKKVVVTGNPLRQEFLDNASKVSEGSLSSEGNQRLLYITGGSGGAHGINVLIEESLDQLLENYTVIHQTGDAKEFGDYDRLMQKKQNFPKSFRKNIY